MIHPYILCLCEEAAVIADKKSRVLPKIPFDVCVYRILRYFITAFSNQGEHSTVSNGTGCDRAFLGGSEGLLTCTQVLKLSLLKECWSYRL